MIEVTGIAHVGVRVADFSRSIGFYKNLGFKLIREDYEERVIVLNHQGGVELNLLDSVNDTNKGKNVLIDETARFAGYTHIAIEINDVQHAVTKLYEMDIRITEGPVTFGDGSTSIFFRDPDGNVIELSEPLHKKTSRAETVSENSRYLS